VGAASRREKWSCGFIEIAAGRRSHKTIHLCIINK